MLQWREQIFWPTKGIGGLQQHKFLVFDGKQHPKNIWFRGLLFLKFWIWGVMISVEKSWVEIFCFINKALEAHQKILLKLLLEKFNLLWLNLKLILEMFQLMLDYKKYFLLHVTLFLRTKMVNHFLSHQVCILQTVKLRVLKRVSN